MAKKKASRGPAKKRPTARTSSRPARKAATPKKTAAPKRRKDGRPPQWWPALAPYLTVRDGQRSIEFYARAFGFETYGEVMRDDAGTVQHAGMRLGEAAIMFAPESPNDPMKLRVPQPGTADSFSLYVYVPDVDGHHARAQRGGATVVQPPTDQFWGDRTAMYQDPDGYHWTFATHLGG